jgi:hypothetical protein
VTCRTTPAWEKCSVQVFYEGVISGETVHKDQYPTSQSSFPTLLVVPMELPSHSGGGNFFPLEICAAPSSACRLWPCAEHPMMTSSIQGGSWIQQTTMHGTVRIPRLAYLYSCGLLLPIHAHKPHRTAPRNRITVDCCPQSVPPVSCSCRVASVTVQPFSIRQRDAR